MFAFTDRILPAIQDPIQKIDPGRVLRRWAHGGIFRPTIRTIACRRGPDPVWNSANCRNKRLFNDRAVKKVAANTKPFFAADLPARHGRGNFVLMKDLSSPIHVRGRRWGAFRMGFRQPS